MCDKYHLERLKYGIYRLGVKAKSYAMIKNVRINSVFISNLLNFAVWVHIVRKINKSAINIIRNG